MDTELAYNKALDYLYSFVDYSLKHSSELAKADFNLGRMFELMELLGNPQMKYPIIHVAGTKGKGSTSALCASALRAAGYKVGLYTSPHLEDYTERIRINDEPISHEQLVELVDEIKPYVAKIEKLTTFEITTALAFMAFAKYGVDAAVFEVGLGGRLDATNIIMPKVSVITSLSYDHTAVIGNTLALIAGEKAGIIKPGVPIVSAPQKDEALEGLLRVAALRDSKLTLVGRDVNFELIDEAKLNWSRIPHFYYNFYVYQYATGIAAADQFSLDLSENKAGVVDKYLTYLKAGGSDHPVTILQNAGVDMLSGGPVSTLLTDFDNTVAEMEKLLIKLGRIKQ